MDCSSHLGNWSLLTILCTWNRHKYVLYGGKISIILDALLQNDKIIHWQSYQQCGQTQFFFDMVKLDELLQYDKWLAKLSTTWPITKFFFDLVKHLVTSFLFQRDLFSKPGLYRIVFFPAALKTFSSIHYKLSWNNTGCCSNKQLDVEMSDSFEVLAWLTMAREIYF